MTFEHQADSGSLFKNDRKEKESQPDYRGDALINGKLYWVSSWLNASHKGTKYMSLKFSEKQARDEKSATEKPAPPVDKTGGEFDDDIPFSFAWAAPLAGVLLAAHATASYLG